jgi:hypothetical protein
MHACAASPDMADMDDIDEATDTPDTPENAARPRAHRYASSVK